MNILRCVLSFRGGHGGTAPTAWERNLEALPPFNGKAG
jgi:hypothetical protein